MYVHGYWGEMCLGVVASQLVHCESWHGLTLIGEQQWYLCFQLKVARILEFSLLSLRLNIKIWHLPGCVTKYGSRRANLGLSSS